MSDRGDGPPAPRAGGTWRVAILYVVLTLALAWPLGIRAARSVLWAGPDTELFMWTLAWDVHAFTTQPLAIFDANIFHPLRRTLAYSENLIGSAFFAAPVVWLSGNLVLAMNVVSLLSVVLCGVGAYVLARQIGVGSAGAVLAGLIFAFSPPRFFRLGQLHLAAVQWIPFALARMHQYVDQGRRRDLKSATGLFSLQALSSGHGAVFLALASIGLIVWRLAYGMPLAISRRLRDFGVTGALLLVPAILVMAPYAIVQHDMGLKRPYSDEWTSNPASFLASPAHVPSLLLNALGAGRVNAIADAYLFPGYLPLALAAFAFVRPRRTNEVTAPARGTTAFYAALTGVCMLLSIGPPFGLWPYVYWMPGFNFIRANSRFTILGMLGLAMLAGLGFDRLRLRLSTYRGRLAAGLLGGALVAEFAAVPLGTVPYRVDIPSVDRWLALQPGPFAVAEVPAPGVGGTLPGPRLQTVYMLHSTVHWQKTIHGHSGIEPEQHRELHGQLVSFPDEQSLQALSRFGVRYVVVHEDLYPPEEWPSVDERLRAVPDRLTLEYQARRGRVYSLRQVP